MNRFGTPQLTLMVSAGLVARVANMAADIPETVCIMALGRPSPDFHELRPGKEKHSEGQRASPLPYNAKLVSQPDLPRTSLPFS